MESYDLLIKGGNVWFPSGPSQVDVAIKDEKFLDFGQFDPGKAKTIINAKNLTVIPGVIDTQVHFREPGLEHKENIESGSRGAALGGVVGYFEMPNTDPATIDDHALDYKFSRAEKTSWVDYSFFVGACPENINSLSKLEKRRGVAGIKMFMGSSTGSLLVSDDSDIEGVLQSGFRRVAVHCEDQERLEERQEIISGKPHVSKHAEWRDELSALFATKKLIKIAKRNNRRVHTLHISTANEMEFLKDYKDIATVEVLPQHLTLASPEAYERLGTLAQMNPPIRTKYHQQALWKAIEKGIVDCIGSDHAPHTLDEKQRSYPNSPSGLTGVQTLVPIMLNHVNAGRLSLLRLIDLTSYGPARIYNLVNKGRIALGYDADLTIVDLKKKKVIENNWIASRSSWTPYDGLEVTGWPISTIVRGNIVMKDMELLGKPIGDKIISSETF